MPRKKPRFPQRGAIVDIDGVSRRVVNAMRHHTGHWVFWIFCDLDPAQPMRMQSSYHRSHAVTCIVCLDEESSVKDYGSW